MILLFTTFQFLTSTSNLSPFVTPSLQKEVRRGKKRKEEVGRGMRRGRKGRRREGERVTYNKKVSCHFGLRVFFAALVF